MEPEAPPEPPKGGVLRGVVFKTVDISVPHGRAPGSRLVVQAEGRLVTAVIPEGARPGDVFPIHVPIELTKMQRLKLAPVQMLDWGLDKAEDLTKRGLDKAEDLTKRAVRKIPGHDRVEALVDRVRQRRPQHPQHPAVEHWRGDSRGSRRGHRANPDPDRGHDEWGMGRGTGSGGSRMSGSSARVVGSIRERDDFNDFAQFDEPQSQQEQQLQQRGSPMYRSVFDSPQTASDQNAARSAVGTDSLDGFSDFFSSEPEPQQPVPAPGAASYTSKGGGSPSSLEAQLDWFDDATGAPQAGPGATASSQASSLAGGAGFDMVAAVAAAAAAEPEGFAQRPLATWSVEEVCEWLTDVVQLPQHTDAFKEHGIDGFLLSRLVKDDLDDLGEFTGLDKTKVIARRDEAAMVGGGRRDPRVRANAYGARLDMD